MNKIEQALEKMRTERRASSDGSPGFERQRPSVVGRGTEIALMDAGRLRSQAELDDLRIIYKGMKQTRVADTFRQLRTTLLNLAEQRNFVLMVTGVGRGVGSTFVAQNLAAATAFDVNKTALVIDANLHDPQLSRLALDDNGAGLTDLLSGTAARVDDIVRPTGIPRMKIVPAGQERMANAEFFTLPRFHTLLREFQQRYWDRYIIIDAPSISEAADAHILAELCDYVLLVIPYGRATQSEITDAVQMIPPGRFIGSVFNGEPLFPFGSEG